MRRIRARRPEIRADEKVTVRPLDRLGEVPRTTTLDREWLEDLLASDVFRTAHDYFSGYPERSMVCHEARSFLWAAVRTMAAEAAVEIGTFYAGTSEVIARALWENGGGVLHTVDPYADGRGGRIIEQWPEALQARVCFHPVNSMGFWQDVTPAALDLVFIDGQHDLEFARFDAQMAARRLRRGGLLLLDNGEQTGPFRAARDLLDDGWVELGSALEDDSPFPVWRSSLGKRLLVLRAPDWFPVSSAPVSWGNNPLPLDELRGFAVDVVGAAAGVLTYRVTMRIWSGPAPEERCEVGEVDVSQPARLEVAFDSPWPTPGRTTAEVEFAWRGAEPLRVAAPPSLI